MNLDPATVKETTAILGVSIGASFAVGKDFLSKIVGPLADNLGWILARRSRLYRAQLDREDEILEEVQRNLAKEGFEPRKVPRKILVQLLESGSLEEDVFMQGKWTALLTSAANSQAKAQIPPSFPQILNELSPKDALLLDKLFDQIAS